MVIFTVHPAHVLFGLANLCVCEGIGCWACSHLSEVICQAVLDELAAESGLWAPPVARECEKAPTRLIAATPALRCQEQVNAELCRKRSEADAENFPTATLVSVTGTN